MKFVEVLGANKPDAGFSLMSASAFDNTETKPEISPPSAIACNSGDAASPVLNNECSLVCAATTNGVKYVPWVRLVTVISNSCALTVDAIAQNKLVATSDLFIFMIILSNVMSINGQRAVSKKTIARQSRNYHKCITILRC